MGVIALDTFSRADGPLVGSTSETGGLVWTAQNINSGFGWKIKNERVVGPVNGYGICHMELRANAYEPITVTADVYPQSADELSYGGIYIGPDNYNYYNRKGIGLYVAANINGPGLKLMTRISTRDNFYSLDIIPMPPGMVLEQGVPISLMMSVDSDASNTTTIYVNGTKVFRSSTIVYGARPFVAGLITYSDYFGTVEIDKFLVTVGPIPVIPSFGKTPLAIESSSIVDITGTPRRARGLSPINLVSSSEVRQLTLEGNSPIEIYSSGEGVLISGFPTTFFHNWNEYDGLDGPFEYSEGMSVDINNVPDDYEVSGSLRWPEVVLPDYGTKEYPVTFDFIVQHDSEVTFWAKTNIGNDSNNYLILYIDGEVKFSLRGENEWAQYSVIVSPGMHEFTFKYIYTYYYYNHGDNNVWLAKLKISYVKDSTSSIGINTSSDCSIISDLIPYEGEDSDILIPIVLTGGLDPIFPEPTPPVDFDGLLDPTVAPLVSKSNTGSGNLHPGDYRYAYAAWADSEGQATAPSPWSERITLTTDDTVTLTYSVIIGAKGYIVYREEII